MDIDSVDLQQCADAIIRLRAEYLFSKGLYDKIHFNFTNGFNCDYKKWAEGYRVKIVGNRSEWVKAADRDYSYPTFREYLLTVFAYAGTISLSEELVDIEGPEDFGIGSIIISPGSPGHAVIVVDMIENIKDPYKKAVLLAQSYMPAQEIEVLRGNNDELGYFSQTPEAKRIWSTDMIGERSMSAQGGTMYTSEYTFYNKQVKKIRD